MTINLDDYQAAYTDEFEYAFDNEIMLNWYPERIKMYASPNHSVLELGIGHGYTTAHFSSYFNSYTVIDASSAVIGLFKEQYPESKVNITQCFFEDYYPDTKFDAIIMGFIVEHVDDPLKILRHYKTLLNKNGRCFITVPNATCLHRRFGHAAGLLDEMDTLGMGDKALGHLRLYTVERLTKELEGMGYRILRKEGIFLKPFTTSQLKSLQLSPSIIQSMCSVGIDYPELCAALFFEVDVP